jgi:outer membrane protein
MQKMRILRRLLPVMLLLAQAGHADTLLQIYEKSLQSDPRIREAEANRLAVVEGKPIARGALLPQVSGRMNIANNAADGNTSTFFGGLQSTRVVDSRDNDAKNWVLELRQSVFRWDQWVTLSQADKKSTQADADYQAAQQDLIVRVASAYFLVLAAEDTLASEQAAKESISRQLEQAQKRFEVGLIAITDVQEAQAAYDQALATEILAKRTLANNWEALRTIIGELPPKLAKPAEDIPLVSPDPADVESWVNTALQQNRSVISSQVGTQIAKDDVSLARTGHYPTVDLVLSRNNTDNEGFSRAACFQAPQDLDGNNAADLSPDPNRNCVDGNPAGTIVRTETGTDLETDSISLQMSLPIFSGGQTSARVDQAVYRHRAARERLERTARETEQQTRDAYLGVISDISRVAALKQALESSRTALKASEAGYEVGTRTAVDVLDAKRKTYVAEALYLRSRYDYLINGLRLKQAAGTLAVDDLAQVDTLLK